MLKRQKHPSYCIFCIAKFAVDNKKRRLSSGSLPNRYIFFFWLEFSAVSLSAIAIFLMMFLTVISSPVPSL